MQKAKSIDGPLAVRDELIAFLDQIKDQGTHIDRGGGAGAADLWVTLGGIEYCVTVRR